MSQFEEKLPKYLAGEISEAELWSEIPSKYLKSRHELDGSGSNEVFVSKQGLKYLRNVVRSRHMRQKLKELIKAY